MQTSLPIRRSHRWLVVAYAVFLLVLVAGSQPRSVGDAGEYLGVARYFAALAMPPPNVAVHFWFYPLLAAPGVALAGAMGTNAYYGFTALNLLLLLSAFSIVVHRLHWTLTVLLFAGPVIWWADKAHTEVFTFSLLAIAFAAWREAPWWSMVAVGAASTQNPPIAALVPLAGALALVSDRRLARDRRLWMGAAAGAGLALLHPLYYLLTLGVPVPLALVTAHRGVPTWSEYTAILCDPNIGLLVHFPALTLALAASLLWLGSRAPRRLLAPDLILAALALPLFLLAFAQNVNLNHGGQPGLGRYALWLMPLAMPLFRQVEGTLTGTGVLRWFAPVVLASVIWSAAWYHPSRPELSLSPTRTAEVVWTRYPGLNNPPPEIFTERLTGLDQDWWLPVATAGCEKILLIGRGIGRSIFPVPCPPVEAPARCTEWQALCYANRQDTGYGFVQVRTSHWAYRFRRERVWGDAVEAPLGRMLHELAWWGLRSYQPGEPENFVRATSNVSHVLVWQGEDRALVYVAEPGDEAGLMLRLPGPMRGAFIAPDTGDTLGAASCDVDAWQPCHLTVPGPRAAVVLLLRRAAED